MIIFNFFKYLLQYFQYVGVLKKVYKEDDFVNKLSNTIGAQFEIDKIGRLWCVFNPNLINGKFDPNNPIYSYNERGLNTDDFVKQYIMTKLNAVQQYISASNLFDIVGYDLKKLDNANNYLFVIKPLPFDNLKKWTKLLPVSLGIIIIVVISLLIFIG